jgi:hypothetical protein
MENELTKEELEWMSADLSPQENESKDKLIEELYNVRMALNAALFNQWADIYKRIWNKQKGCFETLPVNDVHKSWKHNDGELCFGGDWFIVCAETPYGQISFHYKKEDWDYFKIPLVEKAKYKFDGHTTEQVISRLLNL